MVGQSVKPLRIRFFHANSRLNLEVMVYDLSQAAYSVFEILCSNVITIFIFNKQIIFLVSAHLPALLLNNFNRNIHAAYRNADRLSLCCNPIVEGHTIRLFSFFLSHPGSHLNRKRLYT